MGSKMQEPMGPKMGREFFLHFPYRCWLVSARRTHFRTHFGTHAWNQCLNPCFCIILWENAKRVQTHFRTLFRTHFRSHFQTQSGPKIFAIILNPKILRVRLIGGFTILSAYCLEQLLKGRWALGGCWNHMRSNAKAAPELWKHFAALWLSA